MAGNCIEGETIENQRVTLELSLYGLFAARLSTGEDVTPKSAKTIALLALLAMSPGYRRSRIWLRDMLWSDRGSEQAAASLRQALSDIRRTLGDAADIIEIDRRGVALAPDRVSLTRAREDAQGPIEDFLEGLDVRDPEFEEWLRNQRVNGQNDTTSALSLPPEPLGSPYASAARGPTRFLVRNASKDSDMARLFTSLFLDAVKKSVSEYRRVLFYTEDEQRPDSDADFSLTVTVDILDSQAWIRASLDHLDTSRSIWNSSLQHPLKGAPPIDAPEVGRLIVDTSQALLEAIAGENEVDRQRDDAAMRARAALVSIFSFDPDRQLAADKSLEQAFSADGSADHLAWRVYLRMMMGVERNPAQSIGIETEVDWLIGEALALEPSNSLVLAAAAQAHMKVKNNVLSGYEYARRSVAVNPHNPMALDALVAANIFLERFDEAHRIAVKARHITTNSPYRHWWEMGCCLTATVTGRLDEALIHAETSHQLAPTFKPPLRYLLALYARLGDTERAVAVHEKLRAIEPDFTVERMVQDPKYPVAALQRSKLLRPENFSIFGL